MQENPQGRAYVETSPLRVTSHSELGVGGKYETRHPWDKRWDRWLVGDDSPGADDLHAQYDTNC